MFHSPLAVYKYLDLCGQCSSRKALFANKKIFQSKLISKNAKLKLYFSVIKPVVTYACETWILKETITNRLMVLKGKF